MNLFPNTLPIGKIAGTAYDPVSFHFQNFFVPLRRDKPPFCIRFDDMEEDFGELPAWCQIASLIEAATPSFSAPMQKYFLDE